MQHNTEDLKTSPSSLLNRPTSSLDHKTSGTSARSERSVIKDLQFPKVCRALGVFDQNPKNFKDIGESLKGLSFDELYLFFSELRKLKYKDSVRVLSYLDADQRNNLLARHPKVISLVSWSACDLLNPFFKKYLSKEICEAWIVANQCDLSKFHWTAIGDLLRPEQSFEMFLISFHNAKLLDLAAPVILKKLRASVGKLEQFFYLAKIILSHPPTHSFIIKILEKKPIEIPDDVYRSMIKKTFSFAEYQIFGQISENFFGPEWVQEFLKTAVLLGDSPIALKEYAKTVGYFENTNIQEQILEKIKKSLYKSSFKEQIAILRFLQFYWNAEKLGSKFLYELLLKPEKKYFERYFPEIMHQIPAFLEGDPQLQDKMLSMIRNFPSYHFYKADPNLWGHVYKLLDNKRRTDLITYWKEKGLFSLGLKQDPKKLLLEWFYIEKEIPLETDRRLLRKKILFEQENIFETIEEMSLYLKFYLNSSWVYEDRKQLQTLFEGWIKILQNQKVSDKTLQIFSQQISCSRYQEIFLQKLESVISSSHKSQSQTLLEIGNALALKKPQRTRTLSQKILGESLLKIIDPTNWMNAYTQLQLYAVEVSKENFVSNESLIKKIYTHLENYHPNLDALFGFLNDSLVKFLNARLLQYVSDSSPFQVAYHFQKRLDLGIEEKKTHPQTPEEQALVLRCFSRWDLFKNFLLNQSLANHASLSFGAQLQVLDHALELFSKSSSSDTDSLQAVCEILFHNFLVGHLHLDCLVKILQTINAHIEDNSHKVLVIQTLFSSAILKNRLSKVYFSDSEDLETQRENAHLQTELENSLITNEIKGCFLYSLLGSLRTQKEFKQFEKKSWQNFELNKIILNLEQYCQFRKTLSENILHIVEKWIFTTFSFINLKDHLPIWTTYGHAYADPNTLSKVSQFIQKSLTPEQQNQLHNALPWSLVSRLTFKHNLKVHNPETVTKNPIQNHSRKR